MMMDVKASRLPGNRQKSVLIYLPTSTSKLLTSAKSSTADKKQMNRRKRKRKYASVGDVRNAYDPNKTSVTRETAPHAVEASHHF